MKKILLSLLIIGIGFSLFGCLGSNKAEGYESISQEAAKKLMDSNPNCIILDVRSQEEFITGHIPKAICIPHDEIKAEAPKKLLDKSQLILVYCSTGRRSKIASKTLAEMQYTNVKEFGGITTWKYGTIK